MAHLFGRTPARPMITSKQKENISKVDKQAFFSFFFFFDNKNIFHRARLDQNKLKDKRQTEQTQVGLGMNPGAPNPFLRVWV